MPVKRWHARQAVVRRVMALCSRKGGVPGAMAASPAIGRGFSHAAVPGVMAIMWPRPV
jgi:hypothetical protein